MTQLAFSSLEKVCLRLLCDGFVASFEKCLLVYAPNSNAHMLRPHEYDIVSMVGHNCRGIYQLSYPLCKMDMTDSKTACWSSASASRALPRVRIMCAFCLDEEPDHIGSECIEYPTPRTCRICERNGFGQRKHREASCVHAPHWKKELAQIEASCLSDDSS